MSTCRTVSSHKLAIFDSTIMMNTRVNFQFCPVSPVVCMCLLLGKCGSFQGHDFCFSCVHEWAKESAACPVCHVTFKKVTKTLSPEDMAKHVARKEVQYARCASMWSIGYLLDGRHRVPLCQHPIIFFGYCNPRTGMSALETGNKYIYLRAA